jgi:hypothetical protein
MRDRVQPPADCGPGSQPAGLSREHKKRRLKCVFGVVMISHQSPAHGPHNQSVTRHNRAECVFVVVVRETPHQFRVRRVARSGQRRVADELHHAFRLRHAHPPPLPPTEIVRRIRGVAERFLKVPH